MHPQSLQECDINLRMWDGVKNSFTHICPHTHKVFLHTNLSLCAYEFLVFIFRLPPLTSLACKIVFLYLSLATGGEKAPQGWINAVQHRPNSLISIHDKPAFRIFCNVGISIIRIASNCGEVLLSLAENIPPQIHTYTHTSSIHVCVQIVCTDNST